MAFFYKENLKWRHILDIPFGNSKLEEILTTKNKKGEEFLITCIKKDKEKTYNIYNVEENNLKRLFSSNYNTIALCDCDQDGDDEIVLLCGVSTKKYITENQNVEINENVEKTIKDYFEKYVQKKKIVTSEDKDYLIFLILKLNKNKVIIKGSAIMEGVGNKIFYQLYCNDINNVVQKKFDVKTLDCPALFLTFERTDNIKYKKILVVLFEKDRYKVYLPITCYNCENVAPISFLDIDNDGKLEFFYTRPFEGYSMDDISKKTSQQPFITTITKPKNKIVCPFYGQAMLLAKDIYQGYENTYINFKHKYYIKMPQRWTNKVTAKYKNNNQDIDFFIFENSLEKDSQKLLSIKVDFTTNDSKEDTDFFTLKLKDKVLYKANIYENLKTSDDSLKLTKKELEEIFFLIN